MKDKEKEFEKLQDKFNTEDMNVLVEDGEIENVYDENSETKQ